MSDFPVKADISKRIGTGLCCVLMAACASTAVTLTPTPQAPVCDRSARALVLWAPQWRADQKDVASREEAAATGLQRFFAGSGCFAATDLRRAATLAPAEVAAALAAPGAPFDAVVTIEVRELGPVVKLLSSAALVEGGTEVVLRVGTRPAQSPAAAREFDVHWRHGGPGVVKGVGGLPEDMAAALRAGLQPAAAVR